jgi:hypothetical protein
MVEIGRVKVKAGNAPIEQKISADLPVCLALSTVGSMQIRHTMRLQSLDYAIEYQRNAHCRDEEANYSGDCVDARWTESIGKLAGICQTQVGDHHCRENSPDNRRE